MATFRSSILVALIFASLACARAPGTPESAEITTPGPEPALIAQQVIEHRSPQRDYVGPTPTRFEWSAVKDADSYLFELQNEIGLVASSKGIEVTSLHNHLLNDEPRLFFMHFWANDDAVRLAQILRGALAKTASAAPTGR